MAHLLFLEGGFVKDEVHSNHLDKNRAIAERIAQCSQPGSEITQCHHNLWISGRDDEEIGIYVQDDGPAPYQIVQVGAAQTYQPVGRSTQTHLVTFRGKGTWRRSRNWKPLGKVTVSSRVYLW